MKTLYQSLLLALGALALAGTAFAQVPSTNDTSDAYGNTGMGTNALFSLTPSVDCSNPNVQGSTGACNTASGYQALYSNTTGNDNTASGFKALYSNTTGFWNTASGLLALASNTTGIENTASGFEALYSNTTGGDNAAFGVAALKYNTTGSYNTASGDGALDFNTTGSYNTASGLLALNVNTTGSYNTASGVQALTFNTTASYNTAFGYWALYGNTTGGSNTAVGYQALYGQYNSCCNTGDSTGSNNTGIGANALYSYTTGSNNTASGYQALFKNKTGADNTASGTDALYANTSGRFNTASGYDALRSNTTGEYNTGEGYKAGYNLTTGSNNIDIANPGESTDGVAADSGVIRIGTQVPTALQKNTYIAGIYNNTTVSGLAVVIDSNGQLGVTGASSERFKTAIAPMASSTEKLQQLRPVTFKLKGDPLGALRYGLIAEEVANVYPELVIRDQAGRIDGVRYDELAPMLLNELQKQAAEMRDLKQQMAVLKALNQTTLSRESPEHPNQR
jgi:hypothetical protein